MSEMTIALTDANFQSEVLDSATPVLVDFWAPWCGPCRMVAPVLDQLAKDYQGRVKIGKVNVDESQATAEKYHIRSIPTLLLFKGGAVVDQLVGASPRENLARMIDKHL